MRAGEGALGSCEIVLGSFHGDPTNLDNNRVKRATMLAIGARGSCVSIFSLVILFSFLSPVLWEMA